MQQKMQLFSKLTPLIGGFGLALLLTGCATTDQSSQQMSGRKDQEQVEYINKVILNGIKQSAYKVQKELQQFNELQFAQAPQTGLPFEDVHDQVLQKHVRISWYGAPETVLKNIAQIAGYSLQVYGKKPITPDVIILGDGANPVDDSIINVLRNIAVQLKNAHLTINVAQKIIGLSY